MAALTGAISDMGRIRRPSRRPLLNGCLCQTSRGSRESIVTGGDNIDLTIGADIGDLRPIWRPGGATMPPSVAREESRVGSISVHDGDLPTAAICVGDVGAVWRPTRERRATSGERKLLQVGTVGVDH